MTLNRKLVLGAAAGLALGTTAIGQAWAVDQDVQALMTTRAAITLTKNADMDFGAIDYAATHSGDIRLGTDGAVTTGGTVGITAGGSPAAGDIDVTAGSTGDTILISCESTGVLTDGVANNQLTVSGVEFTTAAGVAPDGAGTVDCAGLGTSPASRTGSTTYTILMGGTINVDGNAIATSANYATNAGGAADDPVTLRVVYQ